MYYRVLLVSVLAHLLLLSPFVDAAGLLERSSHVGLERRQAGPAVGGNVCATVDLTLVGITFARGVCICAAGGAISPDSLLTLETQIRANQGGLLAPVLNGLGGVTGATTTLAANLLPGILATQTSCRSYPTNSIPNQCGGCGFRCADGYVLCGTNYCIPTGAACISGVPGRKRDLQSRNSAFTCANNAEACLIPSLSATIPKKLTGRNYECVDTQNDLESCGGCTLPLPDHPAGQDCTAIPNAAAVSCHRGACVIQACERGYQLNATTMECVEAAVAGGQGPTGYWQAVKDASRIMGNL